MAATKPSHAGVLRLNVIIKTCESLAFIHYACAQRCRTKHIRYFIPATILGACSSISLVVVKLYPSEFNGVTLIAAAAGGISTILTVINNQLKYDVKASEHHSASSKYASYASRLRGVLSKTNYPDDFDGFLDKVSEHMEKLEGEAPMVFPDIVREYHERGNLPPALTGNVDVILQHEISVSTGRGSAGTGTPKAEKNGTQGRATTLWSAVRQSLWRWPIAPISDPQPVHQVVLRTVSAPPSSTELPPIVTLLHHAAAVSDENGPPLAVAEGQTEEERLRRASRPLDIV